MKDGAPVARGARHRRGACLLALALCGPIAGCTHDGRPPRQELPGDPERGRVLLRQYGCATCHWIPGVATAGENVGPPLGSIAERAYLGGVLPNTSANMVRWIRGPQHFDPLTAMPDMRVPEAEARDMVAYLYRLR